MLYKLDVHKNHARQVMQWVLGGGVRVWKSINLARPNENWITASTASRPHWCACDESESVLVTDPREIRVVDYKQVARFRVHTRVSGNGLAIKLTDESSRKLRETCLKYDGAVYDFDYGSKQAVVYCPVDLGSLEAYVHTYDSQDSL